MEILSYPVGLLIGLFPIAVTLGPTAAPAHLLLDSRPVCELTVKSPGCMIDLGPNPRIHLLELIRTDTAGRITERVGRWVNRPGIQPEIRASGGCDEKTRECEVTVTWAHPGKLDPKELVLQLDGRGLPRPRARSVSPAGSDRPGDRGRRCGVSHGRRGLHAHAHRLLEEVSAAMQASRSCPPEKAPDAALTEGLRAAGWPSGSSRGRAEIVSSSNRPRSTRSTISSSKPPGSNVYSAIPAGCHVRVISADPNLTARFVALRAAGSQPRRRARVVPAPTVWLADAVAVGG
jgi:hypothetical protein